MARGQVAVALLREVAFDWPQRASVTERLSSHLIELALAGASDAQLADEGFTEWEVRAARAIVRRATEHSSSRVAPSADTRARVLTDAGP